MPFEKIACRGHFFCGYLDVNVLYCDQCSGVLSGVTVRCAIAVFTRGTTYLQVWFSVSRKVIYGIALAVPCEWCKDKPSLGPQIAAERIKVSGCRVTQPERPLALLVWSRKQDRARAGMRTWLTCRVSQAKCSKDDLQILLFGRLANALKYDSIPKQLCCCAFLTIRLKLHLSSIFGCTNMIWTWDKLESHLHRIEYDCLSQISSHKHLCRNAAMSCCHAAW